MTQLGDDIELIMLNSIRYRDSMPVQLEGEPGRQLAADDRRWLLRYIDKLNVVEHAPDFGSDS